MSKNDIAVVKESFSITNRGIVVELRHHRQGLPAQTILASKTTGRQWQVICRLVFAHMIDEHVMFANESIKPIVLSFSHVERLEQSRLDVLERERNYIFEYQLQGVDHSEKPSVGELLQVMH